MRSARVLIGLLVLATVAVDLVVLAMFPEAGFLHGGLANPRVVLLGVLAFGQTGVLAVLVALARPGSPWPWTGLFAGVVFEALLFCFMRLGVEPATILAASTFFFFQAIVVLAGLLFLRRWGYALRHASVPAPAPDDPKRPLQFSLARLFGWMTAMAVCLSLAQVVLARTLDYSRTNEWMSEGVAFASASALLTLATTWAVLGRQRATIRWSIAVLAVPVAVTMAPWSDEVEWARFFGLFVPMFVLMLASLAVIRLAGYRFERTR
ncbi:MAG: hypothetical protein JW809_06960 [Pirellulales bacterium]|nr:hypothetical protein [Pirellulales bacterium]